MCVKITIILCSLLSGYANSASTYDQSQTGDLNVHVDLKDLQIIALLTGGKEEYVDYDYAYDYSEMTIKPQNGTTPKPLNATSITSDDLKDNTTIATTMLVEQTTISLPSKNDTLENFAVTGILSTIAGFTTTTIKNVSDTTTTTETYSSTSTEKITSTASSSNNATTLCKKGFVLNRKGDCELKLQNNGNALLKLVKLSQKLKLRREDRTRDDAKA